MLAARALALVIVVAAAFYGAQSPRNAQANSSPEFELDKLTKIELKNVPLKDAADFIGVQHAIRITIEPGVSADIVITHMSRGGTLRTELLSMLSPHKLGFEVRDGAIVIVPEKKK